MPFSGMGRPGQAAWTEDNPRAAVRAKSFSAILRFAGGAKIKF